MPKGSERIRHARKELGWSQLQLAVRAGVSQRTVQFAEAGVSTLTPAKLTHIAQALNLTFEEAAKAEESAEADRFSALPWSATKWIQEKTQPTPQAFCQNESDVEEVLAVMRENWRLHLERGAAQGGQHGDVFYNADERLNQTYFRYEQRYKSLWRRNPTTIMLATSHGVRTGAAITLPVTDQAYQRLRDGKISFMEIGAQDLCNESQNLILDHAVEFVNHQHQTWYRLTDSLSYTVFCQIAMLAMDPNSDDFRMLSFGASPINMRRLSGAGFQEYGVQMPEFGYPMCEFSVDPGIEDDREYSTTSTWAHFAHLVKRLTPTVSKQTVVRSTLKALQGVVKHNRPTSDSVNSYVA